MLRGFKPQNSRPACGRDHRGTLGGGGSQPNPLPGPFRPLPPSHPHFEYVPRPGLFLKPTDALVLPWSVPLGCFWGHRTPPTSQGGRGRSQGGEKPMGTTAYGGKGSKGRAANGDRPVGAASCRRDHHTMASCQNPPSQSKIRRARSEGMVLVGAWGVGRHEGIRGASTTPAPSCSSLGCGGLGAHTWQTQSNNTVKGFRPSPALLHRETGPSAPVLDRQKLIEEELICGV